MLYFMAVDWNWIAQRPHFLAIKLQQDFSIRVIYPKFLIRNWKAQKLTKNQKTALVSGRFHFRKETVYFDASAISFFAEVLVIYMTMMWFGLVLPYTID